MFQLSKESQGPALLIYVLMVLYQLTEYWTLNNMIVYTQFILYIAQDR